MMECSRSMNNDAHWKNPRSLRRTEQGGLGVCRGGINIYIVPFRSLDAAKVTRRSYLSFCVFGSFCPFVGLFR